MQKKVIVGIDEAGRGPLAGPVVASAVYLPTLIEGLADSKKLSSKKRELLFYKIQEYGKIGIGIASVIEIEQINILQATMLAMQRAYENLLITADLILVDGNKTPDIKNIEIQAIIDGDNLISEISAASIIAKVTRDKIMQDLSIEFPQYGWQENAGYGTKKHLEAIKRFGITIHHRTTFAPIKHLNYTQR